MRIISLITVVMIFMVTSCADQLKFTIEGKVPNEAFDGSLIYLVALDAPVTKNVDSTVIRNRSFSFSIDADSSIVKILRVHHKYPNVAEDLVVVPEPGKIDVVIDGLSYGSGTRLNDILQQWKEDKHVYDSIQMELLRLSVRNKNDQQVLDSIKIETEKQNETFLKGVVELIDENLDNGIGLLLFKVYYYNFTEEKRKEILEATNGVYFRRDAQLRQMMPDNKN